MILSSEVINADYGWLIKTLLILEDVSCSNFVIIFLGGDIEDACKMHSSDTHEEGRDHWPMYILKHFGMDIMSKLMWDFLFIKRNF